jgi:2,3-dihydroxybenzoate decarboxylase
LAGPGVQVEPDAKIACRKARDANDFLAREIEKQPDRYYGFAHLPMQDARAAADELERCQRELKFCGAMINGHTNGQYLDHPSLQPFWDRAQALGAAIYIHPTDPVTPSRALDGHTGLRRATWEWGFETGSHALRLVFGGLFDRFPRTKLILGHLGETLPYLLWRFDSRAKLYGVKLAKPPSQYIKENFVVTTSGMCSAEPLTCAISALGPDRVMFAADYPFEATEEAAHFIDGAAAVGSCPSRHLLQQCRTISRTQSRLTRRNEEKQAGGRDGLRKRTFVGRRHRGTARTPSRPLGGRSRRASSLASPPSSMPSTPWRSHRSYRSSCRYGN